MAAPVRWGENMIRVKRSVFLLLTTLSVWLPSVATSAATVAPKKQAAPVPGATTSNKPPKVVTRNGYRFELDAQNRVVKVEGDLQLDPSQPRNQKAQLKAGGTDRKDDDDGGHYIGRRFKGPTDEFNHFAQNLNLNRGEFKKLENAWERDLKAGKRVRVRIGPYFDKKSLRPDGLEVTFWTNGAADRRRLSNEPGGGRR
jgi:hypothetical protein